MHKIDRYETSSARGQYYKILITGLRPNMIQKIKLGLGQNYLYQLHWYINNPMLDYYSHCIVITRIHHS